MSDIFKISGVVKAIFDEVSFPSGFVKREFVITSRDDKYPQEIKFEATKDDVLHLDAYNEGDPITLSFVLRGNEYKGKYYVSLKAISFDRTQRNIPNDRRDKEALPKDADEGLRDTNDFADDDDIPF